MDELQRQREQEPHAAERRSSDRRRKMLAWVEENVPERDPALAVSACMGLRLAHRTITPDAVRERLDARYGERSFKRFYEEAK